MPKLDTYRVLALDPASRCGWAVGTSWGVWDLRPKRDESAGMRVVKFRVSLEKAIRDYGVNLVVFERPGGRHTASIIVQSEIQGVIKLVCEELSIPYRAYSSSEIKKFATGKGNAPKDAMIKAARKKFAYTGEDDNEADAICLLRKALADLNQS